MIGLKTNKLLMTLEIGGNLIGDRSAQHIGKLQK